MKSLAKSLAASILLISAQMAAAEQAELPEVRKAFIEALNMLESARFECSVREVPLREALKFASEASGIPLPLPPGFEERIAREEAYSKDLLALRDRLRFARERYDLRNVHVREFLRDLGKKFAFEAVINPEALAGADDAVPPSEYADIAMRFKTQAVRFRLRGAALAEAAKSVSSQSGVPIRIDDGLKREPPAQHLNLLAGAMPLREAVEILTARFGVFVRYEKGGLVLTGSDSGRLPWLMDNPPGFWVTLSGEASGEDALFHALSSCNPQLCLRRKPGGFVVELRDGADVLPWSSDLPGYVNGYDSSGTIMGMLNEWLDPYGLSIGFEAGKPTVMPSDKAAASVPRTEARYNISFLKGTYEDFPGHFPEQGETGPPPVEMFEGERHSAFSMREAVLYFVRDELLHRGYGGGEGNEADLSGGALRVKATPDVHEKVACFLRDMGMRYRRAVKMTFHFLQVDPPLMKRLLESGSLSWGGIGEEQLGLIEKGLSDKSAASIRRLSIAAFNGQRVSASAMRQKTYVRDYDVEVAQGAKIGDPIIGLIREGMVCEAVPVVFGDGKEVLLDLRTAVSKILEPIEAFKTPHGSISMPKVDFQRIGTSLFVRDGGSVLLGGSGSLEVGKNLVLLLTVNVMPGDADQTLRVTDHHRRQTRVFDIRDLIHDVPDRKGPEVGIVIQTESGAVPAFSEEDVQAGEKYEPDEVVNLVRERVRPESWEEPGNWIGLVLGYLVAVNDKEVLDKAAVLLDECRRRRMKGVEVVTRFLSLPGKELAAILQGDARERSRVELTEEELNRVVALAEKDPKSVLSVSTFSQLHKQRASMQIGRNVPYVRDVDVEVAQQAATPDPITGQLLEGVFLDFKAEVDPAGDDVTLELRPVIARLKRMTVAEIGEKVDQGGEGKEKKPGGESEPQVPLGRIMLPELDVQKIRTTLTLGNGASALVLVPAEAAEESDRDLVMLITVRTAGVKAK